MNFGCTCEQFIFNYLHCLIKLFHRIAAVLTWIFAFQWIWIALSLLLLLSCFSRVSNSGHPIDGSPPGFPPSIQRTHMQRINLRYILICFPDGSLVKNLPANARDRRHRFDPWVGRIPWRGKWRPTSVFLPRKSHGQRNLLDYST